MFGSRWARTEAVLTLAWPATLLCTISQARYKEMQRFHPGVFGRATGTVPYVLVRGCAVPGLNDHTTTVFENLGQRGEGQKADWP